MRKGLTTLIAVAVALLGYQAMAMAPVVTDWPTPVVGDAVGATFDDTFVWEDALDLDAHVSDQETSDGGILWSYVAETFDGTFGPPLSRYNLNGVDPMVDPSAAEAINPPSAARIDNQVLGGELNPDGNTRTVTIRDAILSPVGGPNVAPGVGPGQVAGSEAVTLFASDGSTVTWTSMIIVTMNDVDDHFSGVNVDIVETLDMSTASPTTDFVFTDFGGSTFAQNASGMCITVGAAGDNIGSLDSPAERWELADLNIYRVRLEMSTTAATGATPLTSMTYNSPSNEFGGEIIVLDNVGSANMPTNGTTGRGEFQFWIGPPGLEQAAWRSAVDGAYAPASNARKFKLVLRLLDVASVVGGDTRAGTVCWKTVEVGRIALADLISGESNVYTGNLVAANGTTGFEITNIVDVWTVAFAGGVATVTADATSDGVALATFRPGNGDGTAGNPSGIPDDYPVAWDTDNQLLHLAYTIAADATGASDPPEVLRLGGDTPTQEIISNHFMSVLGIGEKLMPTTTATTYHAFFYTHSTTDAVFANAGTIRPLLDFANRDAGGEFGTDGSTSPGGSYAISSVTVGDVSANNQ